MTIDISQFYQVFFDEAEELLAEMERLLLGVDVASPSDEDLNAIFRTAHSVKGGASTFGVTDMSEVTHVLETLLDRIRKGEMALTATHVDAFLAAKDILKMQLDGHRLGSAVDQEAVGDVRMMLQELAQDVHIEAMAPVASGFSTPEVQAVDHSGGQRYRLELPPMVHREVEALAAELGLMGHVELMPLDAERHAMIVSTHESLDDIVAICSFVIDADQMQVSELPALSPTQAARENAERARKEADMGYGFFDPLPPGGATPAAAPAATAAAVPSGGEGYGFFQPLDEIRSNAAGAADDARGYGFFEPLDVIRAKAGIKDAPPEAAKPSEEQEKKAARKEAEKQAHAPAGAESSSIRVSIEKVDQLINLVGELVITQAMIEQRASTIDPVLHEKLLSGISQLTRNTRDLQESVMSIRMMPMDFVFSRFPRMVRDLATKLGKKVDFVTSGAATELDKGLIERIVDPLTHLVRNSIDHGIEMPEVRRAAGKTDAGRLFLSASHQGGSIIIEVADDGGGLNRDKILAKARQSGLPVTDNMSDADVWQLIFAPGFSTAEQVTDVSGRGVGMDVVKRNITAMGGTVDIRSAKGFGTTMSISLPLTLAILDGMLIQTGEEVYILPLGFVLESLQPAPEDVKEISGKGRVVKVRGEYLPLVPLYQIFDIEPRFTDPTKGILVIVETEGKKACLFVDELVGQQQVVVKNLESNYRKVTGISGATILGDGGVSLILDVTALVRSSRQLVDESNLVKEEP